MSHLPMPPTKLAYRPDIDGLRAVAVTLVLLYHAGLGVSGGFVGVDVFFVISGYLITSLIFKDLANDRFSLANFWERRIRRIIPPMLLMLAGTWLIGAFILLPADFHDLGISSIYQSLFAANFYFFNTSGYFRDESENLLLLHTWSLSVEEQFYLFFPCLILLFHRYWKLSRRGILAVFSIGLLLSLALCIIMLEIQPVASFYLLPTRAWELLAGAVVALLPSDRLRLNTGVREIVSACGMMAILIPAFMLTAAKPFPGLNAIPPVIGTACIILANSCQAASGVSTITGKLLATPPFVFVGLISYSLYLWHWPLIAARNYVTMTPISTMEGLVLVLASILLATASWALVETPFRRGLFLRKRRAIFSFGVASSAIGVIVGFTLIQADGFPQRWPAKAVEVAKFADEEFSDLNLAPDGFKNKRIPEFGTHGDKPGILLWGDSHAMAMFPAFDQFAKNAGLCGLFMARYATPPILGVHSGRRETRVLGEQWGDLALELVEKHEIRDIFLVSRWDAPGRLGNPAFREDFRRTVDALHEKGSRVWIVMQVPVHPFKVSREMALNSKFPRDISEFLSTHEEHLQRIGPMIRLVNSLESEDVRILDPAPLFLDETSGRYQATRKGLPLYTDGHHLTPLAAREIVAPWLRDQLRDSFALHHGK